MKRITFEIGDYVHSDSHSGKYEIVDQTWDREGNIEYLIQNIRTGDEYAAYPESLTEWDEWIDSAEPQQGASDLKSLGLQFPSFKSYGLTREQVWEVTKLYVEAMIKLHIDLEQTAISDNDFKFALDYSKDVAALMQFKMIEDKLYHRFVYS